MQCSNCYQQTEIGKFCTNCGALITENSEEAYSDEPVSVESEQTDPTYQHTEDPNHTSEIAERLKAITANFGHFFTTILRRPSDVKRANENDFISGIISILMYALLVSLGYYIMADNIFSTFIGNNGGLFSTPTPLHRELPFSDGFLWPFLKFIFLFIVMITFTYAGLKLIVSDYTFKTTLAKYGGYLLPFMLLLVTGYILILISLYSIGIVAISISILGAVFIVPTLILLEQQAHSIEPVYLLIVLYILNTIATGLIMSSALTTLLHFFN